MSKQNRNAPAYQEYASDMLASVDYRMLTLAQRGLLWSLRLELWVNKKLPAGRRKEADPRLTHSRRCNPPDARLTRPRHSRRCRNCAGGNRPHRDGDLLARGLIGSAVALVHLLHQGRCRLRQIFEGFGRLCGHLSRQARSFARSRACSASRSFTLLK